LDRQPYLQIAISPASSFVKALVMTASDSNANYKYGTSIGMVYIQTDKQEKSQILAFRLARLGIE
jgi:hypothetical protein